MTPQEVQARHDFLDLGPEDLRRMERMLKMCRDDLDDIIEEFFGHMQRHGELQRFLGDAAALKQSKDSVRAFLSHMGRRIDQLDYYEERLRIGVALERAGVKHVWFLGSASMLFGIISRRLAAKLGEPRDECVEHLSTLAKFLTLDAGLIAETYYHTTTQRLENTLQQLTEVQNSLQKVSRLDGLTQVSSRRFLMEALEMEWHRSGRFRRPFTILFVDLDHFKLINDRFGHAFGDFVLQQVVQQMHGMLRPVDILGRYGGEEFVIGLVEADEKIAQQIAERIRKKIAEATFRRDEHSATVTISVGVAAKTPEVERLEDLIERADRSLYQAKGGGRNQVCVYH
jgi:diguanylate cyclase (GGDEF)-like protein